MIATLTLLATLAAPPGTLAERFAEGNAHYWAGRYDQASKAWKGIADFGVEDADLYFNLGSAAFQAGRPGEALGWFEKARRLDPHDGDLGANILAVERSLKDRKVVRVVKQGAAAGEGSFEWWYRLFTVATALELAIVFAISYVAFFGLLLLRRLGRRGGWRQWLLGGALGLAALGTGGLLAGHAWVDEGVQVAFTRDAKTEVRDGPTPEAKVLFELPEGQLLQVRGAQVGYVQARLNDDLQGWIRANALMPIP